MVIEHYTEHTLGLKSAAALDEANSNDDLMIHVLL